MLTARQHTIFDFIVDFRRRNGCSPSIPEIQKHFGIRSPNGVAGHLHALEAKGVIRRADRGSRQIDVVAGPLSRPDTSAIPLFGQIPAGPPESVLGAKADGYLHMDEVTLGFRPKPGCFGLRVRGDSMKDAGILDGDTVVIEPTPSPRADLVIQGIVRTVLRKLE